MSEQLANAFDTFDGAEANREDIHDIITWIDPSDTPVFSLLNRNARTTKAHKHEWTIDELRAPNPDNANVQGYRYTFDTQTSPDKVGNYHQIFDDTWLIAETQEAVDKVGRKSDEVSAKRKAAMSIRIDIELALLKNQASIAGSGNTAGRMAGLPAWIATNVSLGTGASVGGYNSGTGVVDAMTAGTQRAFTKTILDDVLQLAYQSGGKPRTLVGAPYVKRVFSSFIGDTDIAVLQTNTRGTEMATLIGAVEAYRSDFGLVSFAPNVQMPSFGADYARNLFAVDEGKARMGWLRRIQEDKDVVKNGDAIPGVMKCECTLIVDNEKAHGMVADLYGINASS